MKVSENYAMLDLNSMHTESYAKYYSRPSSIDEIQKLIKTYQQERMLILGGGCNTFFTDNFDGIIIHPNMHGINLLSESSDRIEIEAEASVDWDYFVEYTIQKGFAGLENLSLIPGTVGAAPVQNIGAYGAEAKDTIKLVKCIDRQTGECVTFDNTSCEFGYRSSIFKYTENYIITSVVFELTQATKYVYTPKYQELNKELEAIASPTPQEVRDAVIAIRKRKLPDEKILPNAGSFFKNPVVTEFVAEVLKTIHPEVPLYPQDNGSFKTSAAFLIDRAGFKNKRIGQVGTYPTQPLVIVNYGTTAGKDIVAFMQEIQQTVNDIYNIVLEPEVRIY